MINLSVKEIIQSLRLSVEKGDSEKTDIVEEDYFRIEKCQVEAGENGGPAYEVKEYAPNVFAHIRERNNVSTEQFLESFVVPEETTLHGSTGRSGSLFYRTADGGFIFKTLLHPEVKTMKEFLVHYFEHLDEYPGSLIMRMYGIYRFLCGIEKIWILVMGNILPKGIALTKYDLKGRKPKPGKSVDERGVISGDVLKDNEVKKDRKIKFIREKDKAFFLQQLDADLEFLKAHNIMDYSLLVGIHSISKKTIKESQLIKNKKK